MIKMNSHEAKLKFSQLLTHIANGKDVIITRSGQDFAKITPIKVISQKRVSGQNKENAWISDDFNDPLPEELQNYFN